MGIGTTGNVAKRLNRNFIGFEISEKYITNSIEEKID
jgi:DNA modification methylase